ncbi:hypothetical protein B484DRAFT_442265 [Ochromonadaceae sp. CCMP2298]|nr:hypothetical protein B484DRAFT_442265 [Ochromonadaceae sp. CCMP2298]
MDSGSFCAPCLYHRTTTTLLILLLCSPAPSAAPSRSAARGAGAVSPDTPPPTPLYKIYNRILYNRILYTHTHLSPPSPDVRRGAGTPCATARTSEVRSMTMADPPRATRTTSPRSLVCMRRCCGR